MTLAIHERTVWDRYHCQRSGAAYRLVAGYVNDERGPHSIHWAACHPHPEHRVYLDVLIGRWWTDGASEPVTFSCEVHEDGSMTQDASLATPGEGELFGRKLRRDEALAHPWAATFWQVVDLVQLEDEDARAALSGPAGSA